MDKITLGGYADDTGNDAKSMLTEIWKPAPGYEDYYLVSSLGNVWSVRSARLLKLKVTPAGYLRVSPSVNGKRKECAVHRLVALAFIPNPENKPTVNHINENKKDNRVENLEWATEAEQNVHGTRIERAVAHTDWKNRGIDYAVVASKHDYANINRDQMKPVLQYDLNGNFIARYDGVSMAARAIKISAGQLCSTLKGKRRSCGGFIWKYA